MNSKGLNAQNIEKSDFIYLYSQSKFLVMLVLSLRTNFLCLPGKSFTELPNSNQLYSPRKDLKKLRNFASLLSSFINVSYIKHICTYIPTQFLHTTRHTYLHLIYSLSLMFLLPLFSQDVSKETS